MGLFLEVLDQAVPLVPAPELRLGVTSWASGHHPRYAGFRRLIYAYRRMVDETEGITSPQNTDESAREIIDVTL